MALFPCRERDTNKLLFIGNGFECSQYFRSFFSQTIFFKPRLISEKQGHLKSINFKLILQNIYHQILFGSRGQVHDADWEVFARELTKAK